MPFLGPVISDTVPETNVASSLDRSPAAPQASQNTSARLQHFTTGLALYEAEERVENDAAQATMQTWSHGDVEETGSSTTNTSRESSTTERQTDRTSRFTEHFPAADPTTRPPCPFLTGERIHEVVPGMLQRSPNGEFKIRDSVTY